MGRGAQQTVKKREGISEIVVSICNNETFFFLQDPKWHLDKTPVIFRRAVGKNGPAKSGDMPRNTGEYAVVLHKCVPNKKKDGVVLPSIGKYLTQVSRHFPQVDIKNANIQVNYIPPGKDQRLRDAQGAFPRTMAEKSVELYKFLLARYIQLYQPPTESAAVHVLCLPLLFSTHSYLHHRRYRAAQSSNHLLERRPVRWHATITGARITAPKSTKESAWQRGLALEHTHRGGEWSHINPRLAVWVIPLWGDRAE